MLPTDPASFPSDELLRRCRQAVAADPSNIKALLELGDLHHRRGEHHKALSAYERVAQRYCASGTLIKAVAVFKQMHKLIARYAPQLNERYRHTEIQLAEILEALGLIDDAVGQYRDIARHRLVEQDDASAEIALGHVARLAPNDVAALCLLADLHVRHGDTQGAIVALEHVVSIALTATRAASSPDASAPYLLPPPCGARAARAHALNEALAALDRLAALRLLSSATPSSHTDSTYPPSSSSPPPASGLRPAASHPLWGPPSRAEDARLHAELLLERGEVGDAQLALSKLQVSHRMHPRDLRTLRLLVSAFDAVGQPQRGDQVLKEAARIAHESDAHDTFASIVRALERRCG